MRLLPSHPRTLAPFVSRLAALLQAGVAAPQAFDALVREPLAGRVASAVRGARESLARGRTLSEALDDHGALADPMLIAVVKAGERTGSVAGSLDPFARFLERTARVDPGVVALSRALLVGLALGAIALVEFLGLVVPWFDETYGLMNIELPAITRTIVAVSRTLREELLLVSILAALVCVVSILLARIRCIGDTLCWIVSRLPVIGTVRGHARAAWLCDGLRTLLDSGVSATQALAALSASASMSSMSYRLARARQMVIAGESLSGSLVHAGLIESAPAMFLAAGEEHGKTSDVLGALAEVLARRRARVLQTVEAVAMPVTVLGLALVVGVMALAVWAPFAHS